jgi:hypothetical protein
LSDKSRNSGYPRLGDTDAAILQKARELSPSITENLVVSCRHTGILYCVQCTATSVCFQQIKVVAGTQTFFKYVVAIKLVAVRYTALERA